MALKLSPETLRANRSLLVKLLVFAVGAFAFGYALVPLYDVLCDVTGFGNERRLAQKSVIDGEPGQEPRPSRWSSSRSCRATATWSSGRCCSR